MTRDLDPVDPGTVVSDGGIALDDLADLQAGLLTPAQERSLRSRMADDPDALALYGLLEQTRLELADLDDEPVPDDVVQRIDTALAAAPAPEPWTEDDLDAPRPAPPPPEGAAAPVVDLEAARRRRRRLLPGLIAAAVVVIAVAGGVAVVLPGGPSGPDGLQAGNAPAVGAQDLASLWPEVSRYRDLGSLTDAWDLSSCLRRAPDLAREEDIVGARPIVLDGQDAVLIATSPPSSRQVALTAFTPDCSRAPLAQTLVDP